MKKLLYIIPTTLLFLFSFNHSQAQIFEDLDALQADSLIVANADNPNFVILDVRRETEYSPEHLMGAINRNYYDTLFEQKLDTLGKHKKYLLHCKSGGRSAKAHDIMFDLGFSEVYNMIGGINAWKAQSFPVTDTFFSQIMLVSDTLFDLKEVAIGDIDTIDITVTNRANAILLFDEICSDDYPEFSTDFDPEVSIEGAFDYSFKIFYEPVDEIIDTLYFCIGSEGNSVETTIIRTGVDVASQTEEVEDHPFSFYPNPVSDFLYFDRMIEGRFDLTIRDLNGKILGNYNNQIISKLDLSNLAGGQYILSLRKNETIINRKLIKL